MSTPDGSPTADEAVVVVPAGRPILEAAGWVGHACWAELRFHEVLTGWIAVEADDEAVARLWSLRSGAAARAEAWNARLPELREMPRPDFVVPSSHDVETWFVALDRSAADGDVDRSIAAEVVVEALRRGYVAQQAVAVGTADAPVARTLVEAIASLDAPDHVAVLPAGLVPALP